MKRRDFIKVGALLAPLVAVNKSFAKGKSKSNKNIVLSTWDDGELVNKVVWDNLQKKASLIDALEKGAQFIELKQSCCVGLGGNPDRDGIVTLDASIMKGNGEIGAVAALERIAHPLSVARLVMEKTPHVFLVGEGAQQFALANGFNLAPNTLSKDAAETYKNWLKTSEYKPVINIENKKEHGPFAPNRFSDGSFNHDTMATIGMVNATEMIGTVTTSGMGFKMRGRLGDSPVIGAGLFVDDEVGAATSSGLGEEVIRICGSHTVVEFMRHGYSPEQACRKTCELIVRKSPKKADSFQVGFIAFNKNGEYGAYAIQKGFVYCVKSDNFEWNRVKAKSLY